MAVVAAIIMVIGVLVLFAGGIWMLVEAFKAGILWGLGCLLLWPVNLIFIVTHWEEAKRPLGTWFAGLAVVFVGGFLSGLAGAQ